MKFPVGLPLLLLSTFLICDVEAQVKFSLRGTYYSNNTLVRMEDIGENSEALICSTDHRPCCGSVQNRHGEWYYPNGSSVRTSNSGDTFYRNRLDDGTVRLHHRSGTALPNANGRYKCTIPNQQGNDVDIVITILNANVVPSVVQQPEHALNLDPGMTVSLSIVTTNAVFHQWQVNDSDVHNNDKYEGTRTRTLLIRDIQETDEGLYSCIFGNQYLTKASDLVIVTVLNPPTIVEDPEDQLDIEEGTTVVFTVTVQGVRLTYNWVFENGSQLFADDKYSGKNSSMLTIYSVSQQDAAVYRCQVSNAAGTIVSGLARLSLLTNVQINTFEAIPGITSALLQWTLAEHAPNTVDHYCLKYFPVLFPEMAMAVNTTNTSHTVVGLIPMATYRFDLLPVLEGGSPAQTFSISVLLDNPIPPVNNVSVSLNSPTAVQVSWSMGHKLLGWSSLYYVVYYSAYSPDGVQSIQQRFETSSTSINITINNLALETDLQHRFEVTTVLIVAVEGLETIESEKFGVTEKVLMDEALFQLLIGPIDYCVQWDDNKVDRFRSSIRHRITSIISKFCDCKFPLRLVDDGVFSCRTSSNYVAYRSKITGLSAAALVQHVLNELTLDSTLVVDWLLLNVYSQCSMMLNSLGDPDCSIPSDAIQG